jgi:hypothetical protein
MYAYACICAHIYTYNITSLLTCVYACRCECFLFAETVTVMNVMYGVTLKFVMNSVKHFHLARKGIRHAT